MNRDDEGWWDAVGKDLWRWQQELDEAEARKQQEDQKSKPIDKDNIIK